MRYSVFLYLKGCVKAIDLSNGEEKTLVGLTGKGVFPITAKFLSANRLIVIYSDNRFLIHDLTTGLLTPESKSLL